MKKPSNELFLLIKTLNSTEISFVQRSFRTEDPLNIAQVFEFLMAEKKYEETQLLERFSFLNASNIKHCKQTLFSYILKQVELLYNERNSELTNEQEILKFIFQIRFLKSKKLFSKANKINKLAYQKAEKYGLFLLQIQLLEEEQNIDLQNESVESYDKNKSKFSSIHQNIIKNYNNYYDNILIINELKKT